MGRKITEIPDFGERGELGPTQEELDWWDKHGRDLDTSGWPVVQVTFDVEPRQRRSKRITLRVEPDTVARYRRFAEERGMGYQTLMLEVLNRWRPPERTTAGTTPAAQAPRTRTPKASASG